MARMGMKLLVVAIAMAAAALFVACQSPTEQDDFGGVSNNALTEGIRLETIQQLGVDDVTAVEFVVTQGAKLVVSDCVSLEDEMLPVAFLPTGSGNLHRFADKFFVLAPGTYDVSATPVSSCGTPSIWCDPIAQTGVVVLPNQTTEITLISRCDMTDSGALDIITALEHDPVIENLVFNESKFILTCEELVLAVTASDQDGDALSYQWAVTGDTGAQYVLTPDGSSATFKSLTADNYTGSVTVCDNFDPPMCASLTFPIYVQMGTDGDLDGLGDECEPQPAPDGGTSDPDGGPPN